ncbi:MAG: formate/nitrite transporter family protein, partial [Limisphaerales bacterium]
MQHRTKTPPDPDPATIREDSPEVVEQERKEVVKERTAISAQVVYEAILAEGEEELRRPTSALAFSGLAAGLSMGFSFITQGYLSSGLSS